MEDIKVGSMRTSNNGSKNTYFSYDNSYSITFDDHLLDARDRNRVEKNCQIAELRFSKFKKDLKNIGYLDDDTPLIKFSEVMYNGIYTIGYMWFTSYTSYTTPATGIYFNFDTGETYPKRWIEVICPSLDTSDCLNDFDKIIFYLKHLLELITTEIIKQGYEPDNKQIIKLIYLYHKNMTKKSNDPALIGEFKDWIPYVYAGLDQETAYQTFIVDNNPDYEKTGVIATSIETAKKLGSIHSSLANLVFNL